LIAMRTLVTALLAAVLLSPLSASALELGASRMLSSAGEPLNVEIPVLQAEAEQLDRLRPELPSRSRSANLAGAIITLEREGPRAPLLRVRSVGPMEAKAVTFLVIADWGRGRTLRTYTVLPEAPVNSPSSLSTAGTAAGATEVIRSTPIEEGSPVPKARVDAETVIPAANVAPSPTAGAVNTPDTRTVRRSETLMSISREWSARTGATLAQTMLGIYRANPEAFGNGMGDMKVGSTLKLPDAGTLRAVSNAEANREVGRQLGIWGQSAPAAAAPVAPAAKQPAAPAAPVNKPAAPASAPSPAPAKPAAAPAASSSAKPAAALTLAAATPAPAPPVVVAPPAVAKDPAFKSLEARVAQAERELAALQARLGLVEKIKTSPPVVVAPPVAATPPAAAAPAPISTTPPAGATPPAAGKSEPSAPAPLTFNEPMSPPPAGAEEAAASTGGASPAASGPKVPALPAAPPFKPAPSLQERALELAKHYWWALAGAGGALVLGIAALVIVRRGRAAAAAAAAVPAQEMTFDLPPIKPSREEPEDLDDVLMRPTGNAGGSSAGNAAAGNAAAAGMTAAAMAAVDAEIPAPEARVTPPPLPDDLEGDPPPIDEAGSMIDLARAYIEMGNFDSAMMELQTALRTGDEAQRAEALRLLDSLPKS
jgi:pilus assembly protein FimV